MALSAPGALSITSQLDLSTAGNAIVVPIAPARRLVLSVNGLTGSGATLAIDGSRDKGVTWSATSMSASDLDTGTAFTTLADDSDYWVVTHGYTHAQVRVVTAGSGVALILLVSEARPQRPPVAAAVNLGTGPLSVSDPQNAAYNSWPMISPVNGIYTLPAGTRNLSASITTAGSISMTDGAGNVKTLPLGTGFQTFPFLPATFTTTATGTFWGDK